MSDLHDHTPEYGGVWDEAARLREWAGLDAQGHDIKCDGTADCIARKYVRCLAEASS
jgi:hypothetical protein